VTGCFINLKTINRIAFSAKDKVKMMRQNFVDGGGEIAAKS